MKTNFANVYESIGYLFYAISKNYSNLSQDEYKKLDDVICQKWKPFLDCSHKYHLNSAETVQWDLIDHLHAAVRKAHQSQMTKDAAFDHFKEYFVQHALPFNEDIRETMLATCKSIGKLFHCNDDPANRKDPLNEVRVLLGQKPEAPKNSPSYLQH